MSGGVAGSGHDLPVGLAQASYVGIAQLVIHRVWRHRLVESLGPTATVMALIDRAGVMWARGTPIPCA